MARKNIFVIGLDEVNLQMLRTVRGAEDYAFHGLLPYNAVVHPESYPMEKLLSDARGELDRFDETVDAIVGHWDFPTTSMLPVLRNERGMPGPTLESVLKCENKYWSRVEQARIAPEATPRFQGIDPRDERAAQRLELEYPFWLKPVVAFSSYLGFRIDNEAQFNDALGVIRENITKFAEPFDYLAGLATASPESAAVHGGYCVAEELIGGRLCTLEGYVYRGEPVVYAVIDSFRGPNNVSFEHYEMPSTLPDHVQKRMIECAKKLMPGIGFDNGPFNIECFWNPDEDRITVLEINPRISKSHSPMFYMTTGASQHEVAVDLALGRRPDFPRDGGRFKVAAKFMPRTYGDATVTRVPGRAEFDRVRERFPEAIVDVHVTQDSSLSDLPNQDSYSFELADVFMGADSHQELMDKYNEVMDILGFRFSEAVETNY